ncbi:MAG TPA: CRISPR-associated protein Cas4 [Ktedonobacteraceae bacterium]|nr:CRISPR-associated protein Cas4 [Ktedonobacteraceae bacterium]
MNWFLEVTDLKQYLYCPRIVFYRYCFPQIRPTTFLMEEGTRQHQDEDAREERRSLRNYGLVQGERVAHLVLRSPSYDLSGRLDLAIATPARSAPDARGIVIEYKYSEQKAGAHFKLQLAAYALLLEEAWNIPVPYGYLYSIPLKKAEAIPITAHLRRKVVQSVQQIKQFVSQETMPPPPSSPYRCVTCEFRRFCNDIR